MDEYIRRTDALDKIDEWMESVGTALIGKGLSYYAELQGCIEECKSADVAPVRHGKWVLGSVEPGYLTPGGNRPWICTECKQVVSWSLGRPYEKYCPNCGAKMDLEG